MKLFALIMALLIVTLAGGIGVFASILAGLWVCTPLIAVSCWWMQSQLFGLLTDMVTERR